jgi:hypothetical protein
MDFDGIDLEELAGSESPILNGMGDHTQTSNTNNAVEDDDDVEQAEDLDALDMDFIANAGDDTPGGEHNEEDDVNIDRVPADKSAATSSSQNTFTSLAMLLKEAGTLSDLSEEDLASITDADSLQAAVDGQIKKNEFSDLTEDQKAYLEALAVGVPHEVYAETKSNAAQYEKITDDALETRLDLQAELIKRSFLIKGFDAEKATKYAVLAMKGDAPLEDAKEARNALVAFENSKLQEDINARKLKQETDLATAQKELASLKSKVLESSEVIPGIKVNSVTRERIFKSMTTPIIVKDENPINEVMDLYSKDSEYKMKLHALHVITNGFKDFSKFVKTAKSSAVNQIERQIANSSITGLTGNSMRSSNVVSASKSDIQEALKNLKF